MAKKAMVMRKYAHAFSVGEIVEQDTVSGTSGNLMAFRRIGDGARLRQWLSPEDFRWIDENAEVSRRMSMDSGALMREYDECIFEIKVREIHGTPVPQTIREAVAELRKEIVSRMNGGGA